MTLRWSVPALQDRNRIFDHIERYNPTAAIRLDERIGSQVENLSLHPRSGRPGRVNNTRELVIPHTPYIVAYRLLEDAVLILRILHGSQKWPYEI